ncbi:hypothetical protein WOLCODRAFT_141989 [Wolfiporia cocos MD-104 SS10]|uniref:F-box domain-containing protein n=1 Tax=Wolfiporia cocos (strain MD-104) TaxID=742152 RepID=A0A2H3IWL3_WOLCO|nr:hypothetical protein WOLCODRAFT_141989 [Wolfiporia cocos MD-104 SS10]
MSSPVTLACPLLPVDVWEKIIDCISLQRLPNKTLAACARTCRSWSLRSRYHLYQVATIRGENQLYSFHKALIAHPENADFVRELTVVWHQDWDNSTLQNIFSFPLLLARRLPHLQRVTIYSSLEQPPPVLSTCHFVALRELKLVSSLLLNAVQFRTKADFYHFITSFPSLSVLECYNVIWARTGSHSCSTRPGGHDVRLPLNSLCAEELTLSCLQLLLQDTSPSLQHLKIECTDLWSSSSDSNQLPRASGTPAALPATSSPIPLLHFTRLRTFDLYVPLDVSDPSILIAILSEIQSGDISKLTLQLSGEHIGVDSITNLALLNDALDDLLSSNRFARLQDLNFIFHFDEAAKDCDRYRDKIVTKLPKSAAHHRENLTVKADTR